VFSKFSLDIIGLENHTEIRKIPFFIFLFDWLATSSIATMAAQFRKLFPLILPRSAEKL